MATLTKWFRFGFNTVREYNFEDVYRSLKSKIFGYVDPEDIDYLVPVYIRYQEDETQPEYKYPCFIIDHLTYRFDAERAESRVQQAWLDFTNNKVKMQEDSIPIDIFFQVSSFDKYRKLSMGMNQWLFQSLGRAFGLNVLGNIISGFFQEEAIITQDLTNARREFETVFRYVIKARVFPLVIETLPLALQRIYRISAI